MLRFELHIVASQLISFEKRFGALCFMICFSLQGKILKLRVGANESLLSLVLPDGV
jgi:hypothetical protein